jgi:hypothetical protein
MHAIIAGAESHVDVMELKARISRLSMICEAMWEILKEKNALPPDLLNLKVAELDLTDGKLNSRKANTVVNCKACNRVLQPGRQICLYCGAFSDQVSVFNGFA